MPGSQVLKDYPGRYIRFYVTMENPETLAKRNGYFFETGYDFVANGRKQKWDRILL
jgi:hypothetical protein